MASTRSILIRGVSCAYDSTSINKQRVLWYIYKDANNYTQLYLDNTTKTFNYQKCVGGVVTTLSSSAETFNKYQVFNILCQQTTTGMKMSILKNNGTYEIYNNTSVTYFEGTSSLYPLTKNTTGNEADAFLDSIIYMPGQNFDDATSETILRGTKPGYEMPELFDINQVVLHANATRSNGVITLNATSTYQDSYLDIPVLPNNKYELKSNLVGYIHIREYYNNITLNNTYSVNNSNISIYTGTIITGAKTNKIRLRLTNDALSSGIFTWSNISLKMKM